MIRQGFVLASLVAFALVFGWPSARTPGQTAKSDGKNAVVPVTVLPIDGLIQKPANLFDLQGKTLRYTPQANGGYKLEMLPTGALVPCQTVLDYRNAEGPALAKSWRAPLSFRFPFGGKQWEAVHINNNGSITFEAGEGQGWTQRQPWPSGGMRSAAAALDARASAGLEKTIAVLWATYDSNAKLGRVFAQSEAERLIVTWNVPRANIGHVVNGPNAFQVRLYRTGVIEMAYSQVKEADGIVGLFTGQAVKGEALDRWEAKDKAPEANVDVASVDVHDAGTNLRFVITMRNDVPAKVLTGMLEYRLMLHSASCEGQVSVTTTDAHHGRSTLGAEPRTAAFIVQGKTVELYVSKVLLGAAKQLSYHGDVIWWGAEGRSARIASPEQRRAVDLAKAATAELDLSKSKGVFSGNVFEVFHYPYVSKSYDVQLRSIYARSPSEDDIALVFTDFRIDDLFGQGGGSNPMNVAIKGIGKAAETPRSPEPLGTKTIQLTAETVWIGSPFFAEAGAHGDRRWGNHGHGVFWCAHECTHRWGMSLRFKNAASGREVWLSDEQGHWLPGLHTPAVHAVSQFYADRPMPEHSPMGGGFWRENKDGTFSKSEHLHAIVPGGYSALDLYVMGLLSPDQVPETFLLQDLKDLGGNRWQAVKVPVKVQDVVAVMGPREPPAAEAMKKYRMAFYLLHDGAAKPDPKMAARATRLSASVVDFFTRATGNRLEIVPSRK
ncbi:MAG: hypothetical protein JNM56_15520 [Planctomycetia bacterium]|nr:hypothetical protein [Planctomycetia bacterium]